VKGIDLQMAVPKSVSTLWAVAAQYGRPDVAAGVWVARPEYHFEEDS